MSTSVEHADSTGAAFLRFAGWVYSDETVRRVFHPAVADLQSELSEAGASRIRRLVTRCRWSAALLLLLVVVGLTMPGGTPGTDAALPQRSSGWFLVILAAALYGGTWQFFGWFVAAAVPAGCALAVAIHSWHNHNPIAMAARGGGSRDPEINLSAIHVAGDVAGLMFAVGSVVIVLVGLPTLWWFVAAVALSSVTVAGYRIRSS